MSDNKLLRVNGLTVKCKDGMELVKNISFGIDAHQCIGIIGESGSGKSMTCKAIMGLLSNKSFTVAGQVFHHDMDLMTLSTSSLNKIRGKQIALIMQNPMTAFNPAFKLGNQVVETLCAHLPIKKAVAHKMAVDYLLKINLPRAEELLNSYPHTLSGGMLQRVMIALALMTKPDLIIADEATTALDVSTQAVILTEFKQMKTSGISILVVTHDFGVAAELADYVLVMRSGEIVEQGLTKNIFRHPQETYTQELMSASMLVRKSR